MKNHPVISGTVSNKKASPAKKAKTYTLTEKVGVYPSETAAWYLVEIPKKIGQEIQQNFGQLHRGFGSLPVAATIGQTTWQTSIFRSKRTSTYMLFLKAAIRKKEKFTAGDKITFTSPSRMPRPLAAWMNGQKLDTAEPLLLLEKTP